MHLRGSTGSGEEMVTSPGIHFFPSSTVHIRELHPGIWSGLGFSLELFCSQVTCCHLFIFSLSWGSKASINKILGVTRAIPERLWLHWSPRESCWPSWAPLAIFWWIAAVGAPQEKGWSVLGYGEKQMRKIINFWGGPWISWEGRGKYHKRYFWYFWHRDIHAWRHCVYRRVGIRCSKWGAGSTGASSPASLWHSWWSMWSIHILMGSSAG